MPTDLEGQFLKAWEEHDLRPTDPAATNRRVEALRELADEIGMSFVHMQDILAAWKRTGLDYRRSLLALLAGRDALR